ncbi:MAG: 23S rRNA (uracil(1939)-C(5))-methyltransferase RlmD [Waddliaceae bacterium]
MKIKITSVGSSGEGVGSLDGLKVFIEGALPGEIVDVELTEQKKNYAIGKLLSIETVSPFRQDPPCPFFDRCGGCHLQHVTYEGQLQLKRQRVIDALTRIGKFEDPKVDQTLPSPTAFHYRNKIQLPVSKDLEIGLYARGTHEIVPIDHCMIHCEAGEKVFKQVRPLIKIPGIRNLYIRTSIKHEETLVTLVTDGTNDMRGLAKEIIKIENVVGVMESVNKRADNVILGNTFTLLEGKDHIVEELLGTSFKLSAPSFFQVNPLQAENLYQTALAFADIQPTHTVVDAYCGVGTLSLLAAKQAEKVIGIEVVPEAIENANQNALINDIQNCRFILNQTEKYIQRLKEIDVVFLNPPRKGCDPQVIDALETLKPKKIVYISCDPATLARDLKLLCEKGYAIAKIKPVDMFPQTMHVETVVELNITQD